MPRSFYKHKLLFDENMPPRQRYPRLNEHFDVKHVKDDFHQEQAKDPQVYDLAQEQGRIIITINKDDFRSLVGTRDDAGVISIPDGQAAIRTDTKLTALLMKHGPKYFQGRLIALGGEEAQAA